MAIQIREVWSDLDHRLVEDGEGQLKKVVNIAAVLSSIDNILRTYQGERVMLPQFASALRGVVFESINDTLLKFLSQSVRQTIQAWDDRVVVREVEISSDPDRQSIQIVVELVIKGYGDIFKYETFIQGE